MHHRSLERFDFDSVLLPYNFILLQDSGYRRDVDALLELCADRNVAVQTIKSIARRRWDDEDGPRYSWYEPVRDEAAVDRAVRHVLADDQLFLNSSSDATMLRSILTAADNAADRPAPTADALQHDVDTLDIAPLFDGAELERI